MSAHDPTTRPEIREIPDFPWYGVDADGAAWSRRCGRSKTPGDWRRISTYINEDGYPFVFLKSGGKRYKRTVHRLVLEAFVGPCPPGMECLHGDGDRTNSRLDNLRWGTRRENWQDAMRHGTSTLARNGPGDRSPNAKFTNEEVLAIVDLHRKQGLGYRRIAKLLGMEDRRSAIDSMLRGLTWSKVTGMNPPEWFMKKATH